MQRKFAPVPVGNVPMKFDLQLLFTFIGLGLLTRKLSWKGWLGVGMLIFVWLMYNWQKG